MRTPEARQQYLLDLVDRFGREAIIKELNINDRTMDSYLKVPNRFERMAPYYALRRAELRLENRK